MNNVESIRVLDGGNGEGISSLSNNVISQMSSLEEGFGQMTGFNFSEMLKNMSQRKQTINVENQENDNNVNDNENEQDNNKENESVQTNNDDYDFYGEDISK